MGFDRPALLGRLLALSRAKGVMIATAESCTAGQISAALTDLAGSSAMMDRGFVTYTNAAKIQMLGVHPKTLQRFGAVSENIAREMAEGALLNSDAALAVAVTGIAGPGGSDTKPEGRVCFGLTDRSQNTVSETIEFGPIGRENVRAATVNHALALLERRVASLP